LEAVKQLIAEVDPLVAYIILGLSAFLENTIPPIPGDTVTIFGAYLAATGKLSFMGVYLSTSIGSVAGFYLMFLMGLKYGRAFFKSKLGSKFFKDEKIKKVERWFAKYGYWVIAANRFLPGARTIISLFAGFFHLKWLYVFVLAAVSGMIWNGILVTAGYLFGVNWETITHIISRYNKIFFGLLILYILYYFYKNFLKEKRITHE
jgi:membrane protein DedA with SNARE-associated domain